MKANKKLAPKVFKITKKKIKDNEIINVNKKHSFKLINTRKYYSGKHILEIQINGKYFGKKEFYLE